MDFFRTIGLKTVRGYDQLKAKYMEEFKRQEITMEAVKTFMEGHDPEERIVNIVTNYRDPFVKVYYRDEDDNKCVSERPFYPFVWAKKEVCVKMKKYIMDNDICGGSMSKMMGKYGIFVKELSTKNNDGEVVESMENGYTFLFYATRSMCYSDFLKFFKEAGYPIYKDRTQSGQLELAKNKTKYYLTATPEEQYLISTGKRYFKGYNDYDETLRMIFDLETTGLDTKNDRIEQIGVRFNRPVKYNGKYITFERVFSVEGETEEEKNASELKAIRCFLLCIALFRPDVITGHNSENFDWNMLIGACDRLGTSMYELSKEFFDGEPIYKSQKENVLKLGGEVEKYRPTVVPHTIITDSLHAVRRAQAIDSNMKKADLKYATKYAKLVKKNRVYVPGDKISTIWNDNEAHYAFNDNDGKWYEITDKKPLKDGYETVTGRYIVERYLLDDLWECDKVELKYNATNFLICKILPLPYQKCTTMGTAGQWKALLMAWSYENGLAIPDAPNTGKFTGGLSRLLKVGYVDNVIKLDYNSLYPSIILTWGIEDEKDLMGTMLKFLEYVLTTREVSKGLKKKAGKIVEKYEKKFSKGQELTPEEQEEYQTAQKDYSFNDGKQLQQKVLGNSFFGSYGSNIGSLFPWKSIVCAERTTCTGRQSLRLMISHFAKLGYEPIVGDSFTPDTPVFIKYNDNGWIDIKPIFELINEDAIKVDGLGREYDYSKKGYKVLCRSGWVEPSYIYRHKTDKDIYGVSDGDMRIDVTEDHSLFNSNKGKIKPSEINENTEFEYYNGDIKPDGYRRYFGNMMPFAKQWAEKVAEGSLDRVPVEVLNYPAVYQKVFYETFMGKYHDDVEYSKTCLAGLQYIKRNIESV